MITLSGNRVPQIQQAISRLEDEIRQLIGSLAAAEQDVLMRVSAAALAPIPHGALVKMTANNTVDLADTAWVGVNAGPAADPETPIQVRGGCPIEVFLIPGLFGVSPGRLIYFSFSVPGGFTISGDPPAVGIICDASTYVGPTGGVVKALLNSNFVGHVA